MDVLPSTDRTANPLVKQNASMCMATMLNTLHAPNLDLPLTAFSFQGCEIFLIILLATRKGKTTGYDPFVFTNTTGANFLSIVIFPSLDYTQGIDHLIARRILRSHFRPGIPLYRGSQTRSSAFRIFASLLLCAGILR